MPPRAHLDKAAVVQAAADLINTQGVQMLSLSRLAKQLGVQTPSLYNHIAGLPGLVDDLAILNARRLGERLEGAGIGKAGPEAVMALAQAYRAYIKEFPGLYLATMRASGSRPLPASKPTEELRKAEERAVRVGLAVLGYFELSGDDALHAVRGLRSLVHGFATLEVAGGFGLALDCEESFRRLVEMFIAGLQRPGFS